MKRALASLSLLFALAACGDTNYYYTTVSPTSTVINVTPTSTIIVVVPTSTVNVVVPTSTINVVVPTSTPNSDVVVKLDVLDDFTTNSSAEVAFEASEDAFLNVRLDGPTGSTSTALSVVGKMVYTNTFTNLACNTPFIAYAWANSNRSNNRSEQVYRTFVTKPCPTPPADTTAPVLKLAVLDDFVTTNSVSMSFESSENGRISYVITDMTNMASSTTFSVTSNDYYIQRWFDLSCNTPYLIYGQAVDTTGNMSETVSATVTTKPCPVTPPVTYNDPVVTLGVLSDFTTASTAKVVVETDVDAWLTWSITDLSGNNTRSDSSFTATGKTVYPLNVNYLDCNTPYMITASASIKAGYTSQAVFASFTTKPCPVLPSRRLEIDSYTGKNGSPTQNQTAVVGDRVSVFGAFFSAFGEPAKITQLTLTSVCSENAKNIKQLELYLGGSSVPFATTNQLNVTGRGTLGYTWTAVDNLLPAPITPNSPALITVIATIGDAGQVVLGDCFDFQIMSNTDVTAKGTNSAESLPVYGAPRATGVTTVVPFNVMITEESPIFGSSQTQAVLSGTPIGRFKIANTGNAKITLAHLKFTDLGMHTGTSTKYRLEFTDQDSYNSGGMMAGSSPSTDFTPALDVSIDGGMYRYFTVVIDQIGVATSGDSWQLSVANLGDVTYAVTEADLGYDANGDGLINTSAFGLPVAGTPILGAITKAN